MADVIAYGVDYSARRLTGEVLAAHRLEHDGGVHPVSFVHRYLDFPGQRWPALNRDEVDDLTAHGIGIEAIYEENVDDPAGGWDAGVRMGAQAVESARAAGLPAGTTIYFCADAWLANHGIPISTAMEFLDGASSTIAEYTPGAYGFEDFVFAAATGGHAKRFWLCGAEIPVERVPDWLDAYQWNNGREPVDGLETDLIKRYRPILNGGDDVSADDVLFNTKIQGPNGQTEYNLNDLVYWTNVYANQIPVLSTKIDGLMAAVTALASGHDDPEVIKRAVLAAMEEGTVKVTVAIQQAQVSAGQGSAAASNPAGVA